MNAFHPVSRLSLPWLTGLIVTGGCALLVACGGGGGGGGDDRIAITSTNAEQVASKTATVPMGITNLAGFSEGILTASLRPPSRASLAEYVLQQTQWAARILAEAPDPTSVTASAIETDTISCASGQIAVTADDADDNGVMSAGDSASFVIEDCQDDSLGGTVSGSLTIEIDSVSGGVATWTPPYSVGVTSQFTDFAITETLDGQSATLTIDGDMALTASTDDDVQFSSSVSGTSLQAVETGPAADSRTLRDYAFSLATNTDSGAYTLDGHGDIRTDLLGGSVHFATTTPYSGVESENFPNGGVMTVTGASDSRLTITVLNATQVRLATDEDGDGVTDATATVLWDVLDE